ncbi:MAG TPA: hypothetical protein PLX98_12385, partial [Candidatus Aminicenantes bacterium]|nr:hypothetical protein [Candidatus Aminicenantes bacterium]HQF99186.1 hypothetical protein [Candidatus Aminicenantes bacterium]
PNASDLIFSADPAAGAPLEKILFDQAFFRFRSRGWPLPKPEGGPVENLPRAAFLPPAETICEEHAYS